MGEAEARKLKLEIAQRDQEIQILVQMLGKHRASGGDGDGRAFITSVPPTAQAQTGLGQTVSTADAPPNGSPIQGATASVAAGSRPAAHAEAPAGKAVHGPPPQRNRVPAKPAPLPLPAATTAAELLLNPEKAFKSFCEMLPKQEAEDANKEMLKQCMLEGKALGEKANAAREAINVVKDRLFQLRNERAMVAAGRVGAEDELEDGPEELAELQEIDRLKAVHKENIAELRRVKGDIDNLKRLLEQSRIRTRKEFETWFAKLRSQASVQTMDEDTKRDLYEKVTGQVADGGTSSGQPSPTGSLPKAVASSMRARPPPAGSGSTTTGHDKTDRNISAFYAALGGTPT